MTTTTEHPVNLVLLVDLDELVKQLLLLRYDSLQQFVYKLAMALLYDASKDRNLGREQLAEHLQQAGTLMGKVCNELGDAWKICRPHTEGM